MSESSFRIETIGRRRAAFLAGLMLVASVGTAFALDVGRPAPEIGLPDTAGHPVELASLRGKVVLVDFWASWCDPCEAEVPVLNRLQARYGERLVIVGVNIDRDEANMRRFLRQTPARFRIVHDGDHQVAGRYEPPGMPSSYLIDGEGVVRYVHRGFRAGDGAVLEREIERLLR